MHHKVMVFVMYGPFVLMERGGGFRIDQRLRPIIAEIPDDVPPTFFAFKAVEKSASIKLDVVEGVTDIGAIRLPFTPLDDGGETVYAFAANVKPEQAKSVKDGLVWAHIRDVIRAKTGDLLFSTAYGVPTFAQMALLACHGPDVERYSRYYSTQAYVAYVAYNPATDSITETIRLPKRIVNCLKEASVTMNMANIMDPIDLQNIPGIGAKNADIIKAVCEKLIKNGIMEEV